MDYKLKSKSLTYCRYILTMRCNVLSEDLLSERDCFNFVLTFCFNSKLCRPLPCVPASTSSNLRSASNASLASKGSTLEREQLPRASVASSSKWNVVRRLVTFAGYFCGVT